MKRILSSILVLGIGLAPVTLSLIAQPTAAQTQNSQDQELIKLLQQAAHQTQQGQSQHSNKL